MRTEEEREGIIEDIMRSSIEAGEFLDALDSANEQNEKLKLKIDRHEKAVKLALETLENNNLMNDEYRKIHSILDGDV